MAGIFEMTDTWTDGAITYNAIQMSVTNTASDPQSKVISMVVDGQEVMGLAPDGGAFFAGTTAVDGNMQVLNGSVEIDAGGEINWASGALTIGYTGVASIIQENVGGNLILRGSNMNLQSSTGEQFINMNANAGIALYYDNVSKFQITNDGIQVDGNIQMNDNREIQFGNVDDLIIRHDGGNSEIIDQGTGDLYLRASSSIFLTNTDGTENFAQFLENNQCSLYYDNAIRFQTSATGASINGELVATNMDVAGLLYPTADGTAGQVIVTDGAGNLSFATAGGGFDPNVDNPAVGNGATANATFGTAYGAQANANGSSSVAIGYNADTAAIAEFAVAIGRQSQANNDDAIAIGYLTTATAVDSMAVGTGATASGTSAVAIGDSASAGFANTIHINASGAATNAPAAASDIEIGNATGRLTWDDSATNWLVRGGNLHVESDVIAFSSTISDERLKSDITPIDSALDKVDALRGVTFTYHDGRESAGVIAQDVEPVLPQAVSEHAVPLMTGDDETEYKTVNYDALIGLLIESVKELRAEVKALKGE